MGIARLLGSQCGQFSLNRLSEWWLPRDTSCKELIQFPAMNNLVVVLRNLEQERTRLASQLGRLNSAISALTGVSHGGTRPKPRISAAGRARIAAAQRARWARVKGRRVVPIASRQRRKLSATALARIRTAQKARWTKWRKEHSKA